MIDSRYMRFFILVSNLIFFHSFLKYNHRPYALISTSNANQNNHFYFGLISSYVQQNYCLHACEDMYTIFSFYVFGFFSATPHKKAECSSQKNGVAQEQ